MFDFILEHANDILTLLTGLISLVGAGIGVFFAVKNWIALVKEKSKQELWSLVMEAADAAMAEAEQLDITGPMKKEHVISVVKATLKASGLEIDSFIDQLSLYIDQTITFVKKFKTVK